MNGLRPQAIAVQFDHNLAIERVGAFEVGQQRRVRARARQAGRLEGKWNVFGRIGVTIAGVRSPMDT